MPARPDSQLLTTFMAHLTYVPQLQMFSMLCGQRQSGAPVFVGQHYYPSPGTYVDVGNESGNTNSASIYHGDDYQGFDYKSQ